MVMGNSVRQWDNTYHKHFKQLLATTAMEENQRRKRLKIAAEVEQGGAGATGGGESDCGVGE
jgi:hypothetical protein